MSINSGNVSYGQWGHYFLQHPIIIAKNKTGIDKQKQAARDTILEAIFTDLKIAVSNDQVKRSFSNKTKKLLTKTDNNTVNIDPNLNAGKKKFFDFLEGNLNPEVTPDPLVQRLTFGTAAGASSELLYNTVSHI